MRIRTECTYAPIPDRRFDWTAVNEDTYDGAPDSSTRNQIGRGKTERDAIIDLLDILEEADRPSKPLHTIDPAMDALCADLRNLSIRKASGAAA